MSRDIWNYLIGKLLMKTLSAVVIIIFYVCQILAENISSGGKTETDVVFNVGKFNGKPGSANSELENDEFKILSSSGRTVQVKQKEQFPQRLRPGQRIALFLESIDSKTDLQVETATVIEKGINYDSIPAMELSYNGKVFYRATQLGGGKLLRFFVPKIWHEEGVNVLEIRNLGTNSIAFDALLVRKYFNSNQTEESANKQIELPGKIRSIASSAQTISESNSILRNKATRFLPNKIMEYLNDEGEPFSFENFSGLEDFYDPYTGKPILAHDALAAIVPLFEGTPEKLLCDIIPCAQDDVLHGTLWTAVNNNENTITVAVATTPEDMKKSAEIIIPVLWSGDTELEITSGILPEKMGHSSFWLSSRSIKKEKIIISDGVFRGKFSIQDLIVFRLLQSGKKAPAAIRLPEKAQNWRIPLFDKGALQLSMKHTAPDNIMTSLLDINKSSEFINPSGNYKTEVIPATKADIENIKNVVPWDSNSLKVEICYPDGKPFDEEWAGIRFQEPAEKSNEFSFWVYTRSVNPKIQKVTIMMYFKKHDGSGYCFLSTDLKVGVWQRIVLPLEKYRISNEFRIVGNPKLQEYKDGNKVSFEFNGFSGISTEKMSELANIRDISGSESYTSPDANTNENKGQVNKEAKKESKTVLRKTRSIILTGTPEKYFEYRHAFKEPIDFKEISRLSIDKDISLIWHKDAQVLEIKGHFPKKDFQPSDELLKILTREEKEMITKRGLIPIGVKLAYE